MADVLWHHRVNEGCATIGTLQVCIPNTIGVFLAPSLILTSPVHELPMKLDAHNPKGVLRKCESDSKSFVQQLLVPPRASCQVLIQSIAWVVGNHDESSDSSVSLYPTWIVSSLHWNQISVCDCHRLEHFCVEWCQGLMVIRELIWFPTHSRTDAYSW